MKLIRNARQRGVTLIELSVTLIVTSIIMSAIAFTTQNFFRYYQQQLDKATAQQTGRIVVDMLRDYVRRTGWGFQANALATGDVYAGVCANEAGQPTARCNNIEDDGESDRLRVAYGLDSGFQGGVPETGGPDGVPAVIQELAVEDPLVSGVAGDLVFISGDCGTGEINHNFGRGSVDAGHFNGSTHVYRHNFTYTPLVSPPSLTCAAGYKNYNFGRLQIADFKIDREIDIGHPTLLVRLDPQDTWDIENESVMVIARDVDDLQISYGIDEAALDVLDRTPDRWCNEPADTATCNTGFSAQQNLSRIVAIQIAVVVRTERYRAVRDNNNVEPPIVVFDHEIEDPTDGYRRWVYRTTVALRNNAI